MALDFMREMCYKRGLLGTWIILKDLVQGFLLIPAADKVDVTILGVKVADTILDWL
jgi:hypothetical protein